MRRLSQERWVHGLKDLFEGAAQKVALELFCVHCAQSRLTALSVRECLFDANRNEGGTASFRPLRRKLFFLFRK